MSAPVLRHTVGGRRAWAVWGAAVCVYFVAVFHRTSLSVAGLLAAHRFHISASQLATFTMLQLLVYAAMQIPVGVLLDRFGSKRLITTGLALMTVSQLGFAFASSYPAALVTRGLVGMGDAMVFVSVLRIVALWFTARRTPVLTQVTGLIGQVGAIVAAVPMAHLLGAFGWTRSFVAVAVAGALFGVVLFAVVIDSPYGPMKDVDRLRLADVMRTLRQSWAQPGTRLGLWTHFTTMFSSNTMGLLWGFPFLVKGEGMRSSAAALLLTLMVVSSMTAGPLIGWFTAHRPFNRSTLVLTVIAVIVCSWTAVLAWPGRAPVWLVAVMVVIIGVGGPTSTVGFDFARTFNPRSRFGRASGIVNVGGFVATVLTIVGIGVVLDAMTPGTSTHYTAAAFRAAMSVQYLIWAVGLTQIWRYRRRTRRELAAHDPAYYDAIRRGDLTAFERLAPR